MQMGIRTFWFAALLLCGAACSSPSTPPVACSADSECETGKICSQGACVAPGGGSDGGGPADGGADDGGTGDGGAGDGGTGDGGVHDGGAVSVFTVYPPSAAVSAGGSVQLHFSASAGGASWSVSGEGSVDSSGLYRAGLDAGAATVTATSTLDPSKSGSSAVQIFALPDATLTAPAAVEALATGLTASVPAQDGAAYRWSIAGGAIVDGGDSSELLWSAGDAGAAALSVVVTNGASDSADASVEVQVIAAPLAAVTAPAWVDPGVSASASVPGQPGMTYLWAIINGSIDSGQGTAQIGFTPGPSGAVSLSCTVTNALGFAVSGSAVSAISGPPVASIIAPAAGSTGHTLTASVPQQSPSTTYAWTISGAAFSSGASGNSVTFVASAAGQVALGVTVSNPLGTQTGAAQVQIYLAPVAAITAPASYRPDQSGLTASVPAQDQMAFQWAIGNGAITSPTSGSSIVFNAPAEGPYVELDVAVTNLAGDVAQGSAFVWLDSDATMQAIQVNDFFVTGLPFSYPSASAIPTSFSNYSETRLWELDGGTLLDGASTTSTALAIPLPPGRTSQLTLTAFNQGVPAANQARATVVPRSDAHGLMLLAGAWGGQGMLSGSGPEARLYVSSFVPAAVGLGNAPDGGLFVATQYQTTALGPTPGGWGVLGSIPARTLFGYDGDNTLFIQDDQLGQPGSVGAQIWEADPTFTQITAVAGGAGDGSNGYLDAPSGPATAATLGYSVASVAAPGLIFVADLDNQTVRQLTRDGGVWKMVTIAGSPGVAKDQDGSGAGATFQFANQRWALNAGTYADTLYALDADTVFVSTQGGAYVHRLTRSGGSWQAETIAGGGPLGRDGAGLATGYSGVRFAAADASTLYTFDGSHLLRSLTAGASGWQATSLAGALSTLIDPADSADAPQGPGSAARFASPLAITRGPGGQLYLLDGDQLRSAVRSPLTGAWQITTLAGAQPEQVGALNLGHDAPAGPGAGARFAGTGANMTAVAAGADDIYLTDYSGLRHLALVDGVWQATTVTSVSASNRGLLGAADANTLFAGDISGNVVRLTQAGGAWTQQAVGSFTRNGIYGAASVLAADHLFVATADGIDELTLSGSTWTATPIAGTGMTEGYAACPGDGDALSQTLAPDGISAPDADHVFFSDGCGTVNLLTRGSSGWTLSYVATGLAAGFPSSGLYAPSASQVYWLSGSVLFLSTADSGGFGTQAILGDAQDQQTGVRFGPLSTAHLSSPSSLGPLGGLGLILIDESSLLFLAP